MAGGMLTSHRGKVYLTIGLVLTLMIVGVHYLSYLYWEKQSITMVKLEAMVLARTIEAGLGVFMMEDSAKKIDSLLEFAAEAPDVGYVRIIDSAGLIKASSMAGEKGLSARQSIMPYLTGTAANLEVIRGDEFGGSVSLLLPIMNRSRCHACHAPDPATLGALDLRLGMGEALEPLAANRKYIMGFAAISILALFGALYLLFRIGRTT
jgi:hypothetical protein